MAGQGKEKENRSKDIGGGKRSRVRDQAQEDPGKTKRIEELKRKKNQS